jgi:hypothetical protein
MRTKKINSVFSFVLFIITISLLTSGGCDIEFSSDNDNGNGGNNDAVLQGTIIEITPDTDIEGITVEVEDEDSGNLFSDITDADGFFRIEGNFSGSPARLRFFDEASQPPIASTNITVFPGAEVDMGDITITNGIVSTDVINVIFEANIIENNCSGDSGTLEVEVDNDIEVIVQVSSATEIILNNDDDLICEDLSVDDKIEVDGELLPNNIVDADRIEVL